MDFGDTEDSSLSSVYNETLALAQKRKDAAFVVASEAYRLLEAGQLKDDELKAICLEVYPELEYQSNTDALLMSMKSNQH